MAYYSKRNITYESDRLPAISGLARYMQSTGAGEYLAGMWKEDFWESLLWLPRPVWRDVIHDNLAQYVPKACISISSTDLVMDLIGNIWRRKRQVQMSGNCRLAREQILVPRANTCQGHRRALRSGRSRPYRSYQVRIYSTTK